MPHKALWLTSTGALEPRTITDTSLYVASPTELLVSVAYSGICPADLKHQSIGIKDLVAGYDYSGTVLAAPPTSRFKPGDLVAGTTPTGVSRGSRRGTHQDVIVAEESMTFAVPAADMPMPDAAGLGINLRTAAIGLYARLGLPFPWEGEEKEKKKQEEAEEGKASAGALLIWGAATQVGVLALQLAVLSGADPVYVTASSKNHAALKALGATHCFDYHSETVWEEIKAAVERSRRPLDRVFDTIGPQPTGHVGDRCFELVSDAATAKVTTCGPGGRKAVFFFAMPDWECDIVQPGVGLIVVPKDPRTSEIMFNVFDWAVRNYGKGLKQPNVRVVPWSEGIKELQASAGWQNSLEKTVIDHGSN